MIIKEIIIENFRSYYETNTLKLKDGLVVLIGDNGDGKTTFFEALEWLFDTSKQNLDIRLISEKKLQQLSDFEKGTLRVAMTFEHDGEKIIEKSFQFTKNKSNNVTATDFQFKGFENIGSERKLIQGGVLLDRCFEAAIRKYCLFKGEENLNVFNNQDALNYLIETFSNVRQFDPYYTGEEEKAGFSDYAEIQSRKAFEKAMKSDKQNTQQEKELSSKIDSKRIRLKSIKERLKTQRENATLYETKLNGIESSKEASEMLREINERLKSLKEKRNEAEKFVNEEYSIKLLDDQWILVGSSQVFEEYQRKVAAFSKEKRKLEREEDKLKGKQELATEIAKGIIPLSPNVPDKISMEEMIKDEFCKVCGREARVGSPEYDFMVNKLNDLLKSQQPKDKQKAKPLFPHNYLRELEQKNNSLEYYQEEVNNLRNSIVENIEFNEARKVQVMKIQESIDHEEEKKRKLLAQNDSLTEEQLQNSFQNIKNWWEMRSDAEKQILMLEKEESEVSSELKKYQSDYEILAKGSLADTPKKIHSALERIMNAFKYAKEKNTRDFLILLEDQSNKYLEKLNVDGFFGIIRILPNVDGTAKIVLQDSNNRHVHNPNQALKTTMYMSVLFAVSELTSIKRENDYPLIFDAPTSSFSPQKESDFFSVISDIKKQCIIFTKSFLSENGLLDIRRVEALNCSVYRLEKQKPFNNLDLSTIQTKITLIKE